MRGTRYIAVAVAAGAIAAPSTAGAEGFAMAEDCVEHQAFVVGDDAAVAARLPDRYTPVRDRETGRPVLFARAIHCRAFTVDGRTAPVTMANFGVTIETPDGRGCASGLPGIGGIKGDVPPACNWYVLGWAADDARVVRWLREEHPGFPAARAAGLKLEAGTFDPALGGAPFAFEAPAFRLRAVTRERPGELVIRGGYWRDGPRGTAKVAFATNDLTSGDAKGTVSAPAGSELAALMGAGERPYLPGYTAFAAEGWKRAVYRRQTVTPGLRSESFEGSCSVRGDVTFRPPATNTAQPLEYAYDAAGVCTGTLSGREVAGVPVRLRQAGHSHGSCSRAATTTPGQGTIAFPSGETIRYTLDFTSISTQIDFELYGERAGNAHADGTFLTDRTPPDVALRCRREGVSQIPMDMMIYTDTPLVSDNPPPGSGGPAGTPGPPAGGGPPESGPAAPRRQLRLSAAPRTARAGRRTAFVFRVRTVDGAPVRGALVRFAGHRARTGRAGRARIVVRVRRGGRRVARVTKAGFRPGRVSVALR